MSDIEINCYRKFILQYLQHSDVSESGHTLTYEYSFKLNLFKLISSLLSGNGIQIHIKKKFKLYK